MTQHRKPPHLVLLVIRTTDLPRLVAFYRSMEIEFTEHRHGTGPMHFAAELSGVVFEIYPAKTQEDVDRTTRLGFSVRELHTVVDSLQSLGAAVIKEPMQSEWGVRAVVQDPDGRFVELYAKGPST